MGSPSIYKVTGEPWRLTLNSSSVPSVWIRSPTVLPTQRPLVYLTHSILPEGSVCSHSSLECVPLGACL